MTRKMLMAVMLAAVLVATGCKSEIDNKPAAEVTEVKTGDKMEKKGDAKTEKKAGDKMEKKADATKTAAGPAKTLQVDQGKSTIGFVGAKITGDHKGDFKKFSGSATITGDAPTALEFTVQTASVVADAEKLTNHLKAPDFFNVEKFATATFKSTKIEAKKNGKNTHEVTGNLTIVGKTNQVVFPAMIEKKGGAWHGTSNFTIKRFDWDIKYPGKADDLIKDKVLMKVDLSFPEG